MKKITIKNLTKADKSSIFTKQRKHSVYLGNSVTVYFTDIKKAKAFITATNEFLNEKLFEVNSIYIELFAEYRKAWFYFFHTYNNNMHRINDNNVLNEIELIEKKMTMMVSRSHFENGSSHVWHGFKLILESMESIAVTLAGLYRVKKHYSQAHQIKIIEDRIIFIEKQIDEWGKV